MIVHMQMSSEEEKTEKTRKHQREYHRKYYKEKQQQPYMCRICGKTLSDISNTKRHEKPKKMYRSKNQCLVNLVLINHI